MRILPEQTKPPTKPTTRRHAPAPASGKKGYQQYRRCLRWDFGFTCPFCLLHEVDLVGGGYAEGSAMTWIEHIVPQSSEENEKNEYSNCVYSCRFCNRARSTTPVEGERGKLLDPSEVAWADHFLLEGDHLRPKPEDADAKYTFDAYDIDEPRKTTMREGRREFVSVHWTLLEEMLADLDQLLRAADNWMRDPEVFALLTSSAEAMRRQLRLLHDALKRYAAIPQDAPTECRCGTTTHHSLPDELERQTRELPPN